MTIPERTYGDTIICPWCGKLDSDSWEWQSNETDACEEWDCGYCEKESIVTRHTSVTYSATPKLEASDVYDA